MPASRASSRRCRARASRPPAPPPRRDAGRRWRSPRPGSAAGPGGARRRPAPPARRVALAAHAAQLADQRGQFGALAQRAGDSGRATRRARRRGRARGARSGRGYRPAARRLRFSTATGHGAAVDARGGAPVGADLAAQDQGAPRPRRSRSCSRRRSTRGPSSSSSVKMPSTRAVRGAAAHHLGADAAAQHRARRRR